MMFSVPLVDYYTYYTGFMVVRMTYDPGSLSMGQKPYPARQAKLTWNEKRWRE